MARPKSFRNPVSLTLNRDTVITAKRLARQHHLSFSFSEVISGILEGYLSRKNGIGGKRDS